MTPGEVPTGLPLPGRKGKLFHALHPGLSLGLLGKRGYNCLSPAGRDLGQQEGIRQEGAGGHTAGLVPPLRCSRLTGKRSLPSTLPLPPAPTTEQTAQNHCSGELPAGNAPPTLRMFAVQAPRTANASSKTRF